MELKFKRKNKTLIILIAGEIDHHTSQELRRQTESALEQMGGKNIIFGFQEVTFMDSSGIGVIMGRYRMVYLLGGEVWAVNVNERMKKILTMSGVTKIVQIYEEEEA